MMVYAAIDRGASCRAANKHKAQVNQLAAEGVKHWWYAILPRRTKKPGELCQAGQSAANCPAAEGVAYRWYVSLPRRGKM